MNLKYLPGKNLPVKFKIKIKIKVFFGPKNFIIIINPT